MTDILPKSVLAAALFLALPIAACAEESSAEDAEQPAAAPTIELSDTDQAAIFTAAGYTLEEDSWRACGDPGTLGYVPGTIDSVADLNGDGRPEAVVSESSTFCFGMTGVGYSLLSKQEDGGWKVLDNGIGFPSFLDSKGKDNWPDLQVGIQGFCFPVLRWNGEMYDRHRFEYEGKPCTP